MKNLDFLVALLLIAVNVCSPPSIQAQAERSCTIQVLSPQNGQKVAASGMISGTASVPAGMYLWIFARKNSETNWWPQGGGPARITNGSWAVDGFYGDKSNPKDVGVNYQITAMIVDKGASNQLTSYVETAERTRHSPGTQLPVASKGGCSLPQAVVVERQ